MKFNFKKITAIATSVLLTGMSVGVAAAANYPAPFVSGDSADVAIVYGTGAGVSSLDSVQAGNIQTDLQSEVKTTEGETTVSGEAYALFTTSRKIYMGDNLASVKETLTDTQLPNLLMDGKFEGDVDADITQKITLSSTANVTFAKQPTDDEDPTIVVETGTDNPVYTMVVDFDKDVNFTDEDSKGSELSIFGQKYTVGADTDANNLYLYKSSETITLSVAGSDPSSTTMTVNGEEYTVELVSASDDSATIKVTDSNGKSESKEISENDAKTINGVDVAVNLADEDTATNRLIAEITVGADRILLKNGNEVKVGSDEDGIDGTNVVLDGTWSACRGFDISVTTDDSDEDAFREGDSFVDPVFGSFKLEFAGMNIGMDSENREEIEIKNSGDDKATITFTTYDDDKKTFTWYDNESTVRLGDGDDHIIHVVEGEAILEKDYVVVGNEEEGQLLQLTSFDTDTTWDDGTVEFKDVFSGKTYEADLDSETDDIVTGTVSIEGSDYGITYNNSNEEAGITLDYPDSESNEMIVFPTIETSMGAKIAFYSPLLAFNATEAGIDTIMFADGDEYTRVDLDESADFTDELNTKFRYYINDDNLESVNMKLVIPGASTLITEPALIVLEEEDDNSAINAVIVTMDSKSGDTDDVGVGNVYFTGTTLSEKIGLESNDDLEQKMDYYGTFYTLDSSESDQKTVKISYPDEQIYAKLYIAETDASITSGSSTLGEVLVKDSEVSSVNTKNLIIVGGSCINSAAATLLGGAYCGASFTDATGVGSGQFLIKGFADNKLTSKHALLVAGYEAADTVNAVTYLRTQTIDTSSEYKGTSSTSAEVVTQ